MDPIDTSLFLKHALQQMNCARGTEYNFLKPGQVKALWSLTSDQDVLALLPTGYGKSLIYEMLPYIKPSVLTIIISPLTALIEQQVLKLGSRATRATNLTTGVNQDFVVDHPEQFLSKPVLEKLRAFQQSSERPVCIVVDEAHCIVSWGPQFRRVYYQLQELKAMFPNAVILAMTATATVRTRKEIQSQLGLKSPLVVEVSEIPKGPYPLGDS